VIFAAEESVGGISQLVGICLGSRAVETSPKIPLEANKRNTHRRLLGVSLGVRVSGLRVVNGAGPREVACWRGATAEATNRVKSLKR